MLVGHHNPAQATEADALFLHLNLHGGISERAEKDIRDGKSDVVYPFDPEFQGYCDRHAESLEKILSDPWLSAVSRITNCHFLRRASLKYTSAVHRIDPCHIAAANFMAQRNRTKPTKDDDRDFLQFVVSGIIGRWQWRLKR